MINARAHLRLPALVISLALVTMIATGCDRVEYRAFPGDSVQSGWASPERPWVALRSSVAVALLPDEQHFLAVAAQASRFEIEASRIAIARAGSKALRSYAEATLRDRVSVDLDLEQLAESVGVVLPSRLDDDFQTRIAMLEQLNGYEFDRAYARNVGIVGQERTLAAFERAADRRGERVQRFAAARIPALRKHLEWARRLSAEIDKSDMA